MHMSTNLLYHAFGMVDYEYTKTEYHSGKITFYMEAKGRALHCPQCGNCKVSPKKTVKRTFITVPIGKNHKYITLVLDLRSGAVVFVSDGKGADALDPFWKQLKSSKAKIKAVATDMSPAYIEAVRKNLPDATLVFDHFHIVKLFNEKLTKLRRNLYKELDDPDEKKISQRNKVVAPKEPYES